MVGKMQIALSVSTSDRLVTAGVRAGDAASAGWQVTLCDPVWHMPAPAAVRRF